MTDTDILLSEACAQMIVHPSLVLMDAVERYRWLLAGLSTPFDTYGYGNTIEGWASAIVRAEDELAECVREAKAAA